MSLCLGLPGCKASTTSRQGFIAKSVLRSVYKQQAAQNVPANLGDLPHQNGLAGMRCCFGILMLFTPGLSTPAAAAEQHVWHQIRCMQQLVLTE